jgi:RimJ/RimL family protein N-acetyltransferase
MLCADSPVLTIRPLGPADLPRLARGFRALGARSRYHRYGRLAISEAEALAWVAELDGPAHFALGACAAGTGLPIGVARYVRWRGSPDDAEIAVTILDRWQGRGTGRRLATALAEHAARAGIRRLHASVLADNAPAIRLMRRLGAPRAPATGGMVELCVQLGHGGA